MTAFKREERYFVFKISDLTPDEVREFNRITGALNKRRIENGKQALMCAVVESDWPEYEPVWKAIEERITK